MCSLIPHPSGLPPDPLPCNRVPSALYTPQAADPDSLTRFAAWPSIRLLHCLAGGAWCLALLAQLATARHAVAHAARQQHHHHHKQQQGEKDAQQQSNRHQHHLHHQKAAAARLHCVSGYVMLIAAAAVSLGYLQMELVSTVMTNYGPAVCWSFYRPVAAYFAVTAVAAAAAATAAAAAGRGGADDTSSGSSKDLVRSRMRPASRRRALQRAHAAAALRHAAAGLTFALARVLVLVVGFATHFSGAVDVSSRPDQRMRLFLACSYAAGAICVGGTEVVLLKGRRGWGAG
jgi:hypothetical protein